MYQVYDYSPKMIALIFLGRKMAAIFLLLVMFSVNLIFEEHSTNVIDGASLIQRPRRELLVNQSRYPDCILQQEYHFRKKTRMFLTGGTRVPYESARFPLWQVGLHQLIDKKWSFKCGALVIGRKWILTAAHCVSAVEAKALELFGQKSHEACFNSSSRDQVSCYLEPKEVMFAYSNSQGTNRMLRSKKIFPHPEKGLREVEYANDIALVELKDRIPMAMYVPICLSRGGKMNKLQKRVWCLGWGKQDRGEYGQSKSRYLKVTEMTTVHKSKCNWEDKAPVPHVVCGSPINGTSCEGDSGGPLTAFEYNVYFVIGLSAFSDQFQKFSPPAYTKVSHFIPWIKKTVGNGLDRAQFKS